MINIYKTQDYIEWFDKQVYRVQAQLDARILRLSLDRHFGHVRKLTAVLYELKFNNGLRIYFTEIRKPQLTVILLLGGNKNGQEKDIRKAHKIAEKIHADQRS